MQDALFKLMIFLHRAVRAVALRALDKRIRPRSFSNEVLRQYAHLFDGAVLNVSGWKDSDAEGSTYRSYFTKATDYAVSNVSGQGKGLGGAPSGYREIELDLTAELPPGLRGAFDVVFNHTTLEHIYDFKRAFSALCAISRDAVILVVPVMQQIHHDKDFGDYWRPTTMTVAKLFLENGFEPIVLKCNDQPFAPVYCFAIGVRHPANYAGLIKPDLDFEMGRFNYGSSLRPQHISGLIRPSALSADNSSVRV